MQDLFFETIAVQRIGLLAKLAVHSDCSCDEKDVKFSWLVEFTADLEKRLDSDEIKSPSQGAS